MGLNLQRSNHRINALGSFLDVAISTPVLATLLGYVAASKDPIIGGSLLLTYTTGYVAPLLLAASFAGALQFIFKMNLTNKASIHAEFAFVQEVLSMDQSIERGTSAGWWGVYVLGQAFPCNNGNEEDPQTSPPCKWWTSLGAAECQRLDKDVKKRVLGIQNQTLKETRKGRADPTPKFHIFPRFCWHIPQTPPTLAYDFLLRPVSFAFCSFGVKYAAN
ncbi:hypothetical protein SLEP1_g26616 [Rubroshorea leprosula]|uniref:ABC transmembrane type-1 domain-containing protein n=1 Tax=Rubroshorea leprosula TaxID=152421 RepID=A0AAV5JT36_9ROSI|nr:hypothetical protein SLEP1_g26616 [Rubroshorea leprosula]